MSVKGTFGTFYWTTNHGTSEERYEGVVKDFFRTPSDELLYQSDDGRWWNTFDQKE
jgi:hypothetical protein